jgi:hypothetical protein
MDHLQTDQERRTRWYSHTLTPVRACEPAKHHQIYSEPPENTYKSVRISSEWLQREHQVSPRDLLATVG